MNAFPQVKAAAKRVDKNLTAMSSSLIRVGKQEVKIGFSFGISRHGPSSP
jgi:hypothetical protein